MAAPATVDGKFQGPAPLGNREGGLKCLIREPGDLPVEPKQQKLSGGGLKGLTSCRFLWPRLRLFSVLLSLPVVCDERRRDR